LIVWISLTYGKLPNWDAPRSMRRKPGRQRKYSNHAIETAVTLGMVFHLTSRRSEGILRSLFALLNLDNEVPDHTTISRRKAKLGKRKWHKESDYSKRSKVETTFHRYKAIVGSAMQARGLSAQRVGQGRVQDSERHDGARDA
jgi:hypothetical protein